MTRRKWVLLITGLIAASGIPLLYKLLYGNRKPDKLKSADEGHQKDSKQSSGTAYENTTAADSYDLIIIGAGSAGCIIASNLAADFPDKSILLLEAGPPVDPNDKIIWDPKNWVLVSEKEAYEWGYQSVPQPGLNNRVIPMGRAKGPGGCSIHNAMVYVRGGSLGFNNWAKEGNKGWDYNSILPYFKAVESRMKINTIPDKKDPFITDLITACTNQGMPYIPDYNETADQPGASLMRFAIANNKRETTASVFLSEVPDNLSVLTKQHVEKILIDPHTKQARSVVIRSLADGIQKEISARHEIILSAGAIGSPHILMLSGVGAREELRDFNIDVVKDLPGVGKNFQDDLYVTTWFKSRKPMPPQPYGLMGAVIFANSPYHDPTLGTDIECSLAAGIMPGMGLASDQQQSYFIYPNIQLLKSRGRISLASAHPKAFPLIDPNYLGDENDLMRCIWAVKMALKIGRDKGLSDWYDGTVMPASENELEEYVRSYAGTCYHYAGTCKMGPAADVMAVVSPDLKVYGISNLRVIDASVIPTTVSGNTAGATMMIAQKGSRLIAESLK